MNFELTEEQLMIKNAARDFAVRELLPDVIERDANSRFPARQMKMLAELGFFGICVDPKYDGGGMDNVSYVLALEEIAKIDASAAVVLAVHNSLACYGIEHYANEEQKQKYLPALARGEKIGAFLLSEPEAGSDATSQKTIAEDKGDYYLLNGTKNWITSADNAGIYLVMAQTYPEKKHKGINAFIVDRHTPGITLGPHEDKMGMRSSDTHSVMFTDVKVPKENRIGEDGFGFSFAMKLLDGGRIGIAAQAIGIAGGAFDLALKYSKERKAFGTEICNHQAIAFKLADMAVKLENGRNLVRKCAWMKDNGKNFSLESAMAKLYCAEAAMEITTEAVQIHGGYGYVKEYHVERLMREAKVTQIYEGTSEIQKIVISRTILKD
ncbi:MAG: acyl-CoA dehydrogenase family protein [Bacteroidales bacterium]|nr:acyl-CoA dehydrogenase family protein [Bacteroidales bacterium]